MINVILDAHKILTDFSDLEAEKIKNDLMILNPMYASAKKYSKWGSVSTAIPKYLEYFEEYYDNDLRKNVLAVPIGFNIPFEYETVEDRRIENTVHYEPFRLTLRDTQVEAYDAYIRNTENGIFSIPTGKGKSILGIYIAYKLRQKTLVIVHKDDLVTGWTNDIKLCFDNINVGLYKAQKRILGEQFTIATIQTMSRMSEEDLEEFSSNFGLVIVDEQHHISSNIYSVLFSMKCAYKVGLSATPERSDGLEPVMHFHLGNFAYVYKTDSNDKDILPVEVITNTANVVFRPLVKPIIRKDIVYEYVIASETDDVSKCIYIDEAPATKRPKIPHTYIDDLVVTDSQYKKLVCTDIIKEFNQNRSIIVFFRQKSHCRIWKDYLCSLNVPEDKIILYYGDMAVKKDVLLNRAENEKPLITLATYAIATEGTNVKQWEVAFLVSSMSDEKNTEQAVGRIRRSKEDKIAVARVYDYSLPKVYTMSRHFYSRLRRYRKLKFKIKNSESKKLFGRGY